MVKQISAPDMPTGPVLPTALELESAFRSALKAMSELNAALTFRSDATASVVMPAGSAEWTNALLNCLLRMGTQRGFNVYPRRLYFARESRASNSNYDWPVSAPDDQGEYMLDACWTRYPQLVDWVQALQRGERGNEGRIALACECEWASDVVAVLDDFAKLTELRAPLKILVFSFRRDQPTCDFASIVDLCRRAAEPIEAAENYLLWGWPFEATWPDRLSTLKTEILSRPARQHGAMQDLPR